MYIKKMELNNFRNYEELTIEFSKNINVFIGENAQGKTNLLESIYVAATGKSFRTNKDRELIKFEEKYCNILCTYESDYEKEIEIHIGEDGKKRGSVNGIVIEKKSEIIGNILLTVFSPEDLSIVKEEASKRRLFLNRELCQLKLSYYRNLNVLYKILKQRNTYLKEENIDQEMLFVWDEKMIEIGSKIITERKTFVDKLNRISSKIHKDITKGAEYLEVEYYTNVKEGKNIEEEYRKALGETFQRDKERGNTKVGPHRDDLMIKINGKNVRQYGSQGQQRLSALSLKLAEIEIMKEELGETPILLLDDVLSELDERRQEYLINSLKDIQTFITTTHLSGKLMNLLQIDKLVRVEKGTIV